MKAESLLTKIGYKLLTHLRDRFYRWSGEYGIREAIFFPARDREVYIRYSQVLKELRNLNINKRRKVFLLEVGSGGDGLARFLKYSGQYQKYNIILADIQKDKLKNVKLGMPIVADGKYLPFKDNIFDIVVSVDVIEHVPQKDREKFLKELKRVSKDYVLLHLVAHDPEYGFLGKFADQKFHKWYVKTFGMVEQNTIEHLEMGHPNISEIKKVLSNPTIKGTQNIDVWLKCVVLAYRPIIRLFCSLIYLLRWKKKDKKPPFYGCFFTFSKYLKDKRFDAIIVDLDYTLVNTNTTFDFLKFVHPKRYGILSKLLRPLLLLNRISRRDIYKTMLVLLCLFGISKEMLEHHARTYFDKSKEKWDYNRDVLSFLKNFQGKKILLSASLDVIVKNFKELGYDYTIGSKMLYKNDRFYWLSDLHGRKHAKVKQLLEHFDKLIIIDDSPEQEFYSMSNKIIVLSPGDIKVYGHD